jgi:hypothetical protein
VSRHKNKAWQLSGTDIDGTSLDVSHDHIQFALLMDIRDELQELNALLHHNAVAIPELLRAIKRNTTKPKRKPKP